MLNQRRAFISAAPRQGKARAAVPVIVNDDGLIVCEAFQFQPDFMAARSQADGGSEDASGFQRWLDGAARLDNAFESVDLTCGL